MAAENIPEEWIQELLEPLQNDSAEYQHQQQMLLQFQRRMRSLESLYAEIYSSVTALEKQLSQKK